MAGWKLVYEDFALPPAVVETYHNDVIIVQNGAETEQGKCGILTFSFPIKHMTPTELECVLLFVKCT